MPSPEPDTLTLDDLGVLSATSKSSLRIDYLRHYEEFFTPYRNQEINFLEIGVQNGASQSMWKTFFPKATIVGIDIAEKALKYASERSVIKIGSQADKRFLAQVATAYPPTIVVDDGSHRADHVVYSFQHLFPLVQPGGCYVIEDLFLHFGESAARWRGNATIAPHDYLQKIIPHILSNPPPPRAGAKVKLLDQIDRFCVVPGAAFVWKKRSINLADRIAHAWALVEQTNIPVNWVYLSIFILRHDGPAEQAEQAAAKAVELEPILRSYRALATAKARRGDIDGAKIALECAKQTAKRPIDFTVIEEELAKLPA